MTSSTANCTELPPPPLEVIPYTSAAWKANQRLWQDIPANYHDSSKTTPSTTGTTMTPFGLVVRSDNDGFYLRDDIKLLPSSFVHASIRSPNVVFRDRGSDFGSGMILAPHQPIIVKKGKGNKEVITQSDSQSPITSEATGSSGTLQNTSSTFKQQQQQRHHQQVSVVLCYATDGGTGRRFPADGREQSVLQTHHGQGCRQKDVDKKMCIRNIKMPSNGIMNNKNNKKNHNDTSSNIGDKSFFKSRPDQVCLMDKSCRCNDLSSYLPLTQSIAEQIQDDNDYQQRWYHKRHKKYTASEAMAVRQQNSSLLSSSLRASIAEKVSYADFLVHHARRRNRRLTSPPYSIGCWYEGSHRMDEVVDGSNSLWLLRNSWWYDSASSSTNADTNVDLTQYRGWSECLLRHAKEQEHIAVDAFVIELPPISKRKLAVGDGHDDRDTTSVSEQRNAGAFQKERRDEILCSLMNAKRIVNQLHNLRLRYGDKPVLLLEETQGMSDQENFNKEDHQNNNQHDDGADADEGTGRKRSECQRMWGGTECGDGYRKYFVAQPLHFVDGSCLAVPDGCQDVYFFPPYKRNDVENGNGKKKGEEIIPSCNITIPAVCAAVTKRTSIKAAKTNGQTSIQNNDDNNNSNNIIGNMLRADSKYSAAAAVNSTRRVVGSGSTMMTNGKYYDNNMDQNAIIFQQNNYYVIDTTSTNAVPTSDFIYHAYVKQLVLFLEPQLIFISIGACFFLVRVRMVRKFVRKQWKRRRQQQRRHR